MRFSLVITSQEAGLLEHLLRASDSASEGYFAKVLRKVGLVYRCMTILRLISFLY